VIDEAQNLTRRRREVRLLSNLETEKSKLLQIVLAGQPDLRDTIAFRAGAVSAAHESAIT
jgi:type II secretory pathway predicted ATPase ExeA